MVWTRKKKKVSKLHGFREGILLRDENENDNLRFSEIVFEFFFS
jgi:hypothetical protein